MSSPKELKIAKSFYTYNQNSNYEVIILVKRKWDKIAIAFVLPYMLFICAFMIYPIIMAVMGSVADWDILNSKLTYVGLVNYMELFKSTDFYQTLLNTLIYFIIQIPASIILGLFFALLLNRNIRFKDFFRGIYFLPLIVGSVVLAFIWSWLFADINGVFNYFLDKIGLHGINWLTDPKLTMISISLTKVWTDVGFYAVVFLAALQSIPKELLEASYIDGAKALRIFWSIKLPMLNPTIVFSVMMATIWGMQIFTEPYIMTGGGPLGSSMTPTLYLYNQGFVFGKMGYASAVGVVTAIIIFIITIIERKVIERDIYS